MAGSTGSTAGAGSSAGKAAKHAAGGKVSPENELVLGTADAASAGGAAKAVGSSGQVQFASEGRVPLHDRLRKRASFDIVDEADTCARCKAGRRQQATNRRVERSGRMILMLMLTARAQRTAGSEQL